MRGSHASKCISPNAIYHCPDIRLPRRCLQAPLCANSYLILYSLAPKRPRVLIHGQSFRLILPTRCCNSQDLDQGKPRPNRKQRVSSSINEASRRLPHSQHRQTRLPFPLSLAKPLVRPWAEQAAAVTTSFPARLAGGAQRPYWRPMLFPWVSRW